MIKYNVTYVPYMTYMFTVFQVQILKGLKRRHMGMVHTYCNTLKKQKNDLDRSFTDFSGFQGNSITVIHYPQCGSHTVKAI